MDELKSQIKQLQSRTNDVRKKLDIENKTKQIRELKAQSLHTDFWKDAQSAKRVMQTLAELEQEVAQIEALDSGVQELLGMIDLAHDSHASGQSSEEDFEAVKADMVESLEHLNQQLSTLEMRVFLGGAYDRNGAILSVHSGQGGVEAMDWAEMLLRMYTRYGEAAGFKTELIEKTPGEEAGIKDAMVELNGAYAYGYLKGEAGTHRLVRLSPFNAQSLRQTSFALVEVLPVIEEDTEVELKDEEIEFSAFRSSGPGGQNVNKVSTAVRLKHIPSGIVVSCQSERSQSQNREKARRVLRGKLMALKLEEQELEKNRLKGEHKVAGWGNQIRSYVLHPYKQVKDLRTGVEIKQPEKVLDGYLQPFIEAELRR